jgi:primosomal protein N' (replication factor Y) (superfamily II helicase)
VVNADMGLHMPDFRAGERTYQIISQVAGRAGRGLTPGRAIVQTYIPGHYALRAVARQSYEEFYREESAFRRTLGYPPFNRVVRFVYAHTSFSVAQREAVRLSEMLRKEIAVRGLPDLHLVGPAPAYLQRLRGRYRWHLLLKGLDPLLLLTDMFLPDGWVVDVDPVNVL